MGHTLVIKENYNVIEGNNTINGVNYQLKVGASYKGNFIN